MPGLARPLPQWPPEKRRSGYRPATPLRAFGAQRGDFPQSSGLFFHQKLPKGDFPKFNAAILHGRSAECPQAPKLSPRAPGAPKLSLGASGGLLNATQKRAPRDEQPAPDGRRAASSAQVRAGATGVARRKLRLADYSAVGVGFPSEPPWLPSPSPPALPD